MLSAMIPLAAQALQFETGLWEVTMQSMNPMTGQPINEITTECIKDRNFDPAEQMMEDGTCRIVDKQESKNTVTWKMECGGGDMPAFNGEGTFISHGDSAEGEMKMVMVMGTTTMEMRNNWKGKRISPKCTAE